jgi:hypothetical protein
MPRRSFEDLLDDFPRAHLVVGHVESLKATATGEKAVSRLIDSLGPRADWATGQMQNGRGFAVHCVFARPEDAQKLAAAVQAKGIGRYPGFASQREFTLDTGMRKNISAALSEHRARGK